MRDCPIFRVEIERTQYVELYLAAETLQLARDAARYVCYREVEDWGEPDHDVYVGPNPLGHLPLARSMDTGIWVVDERDPVKGHWVFSADDIPQVPPPPDPNQGVLPGLPNPLEHRDVQGEEARILAQSGAGDGYGPPPHSRYVDVRVKGAFL